MLSGEWEVRAWPHLLALTLAGHLTPPRASVSSCVEWGWMLMGHCEDTIRNGDDDKISLSINAREILFPWDEHPREKGQGQGQEPASQGAFY